MTKILLGQLIRKLRKEKNLYIEDFAKLVNTSYVTISNIENGKYNGKRELLKRIADALDYDRDELLALAEKIDEEIEEIITKIPKVIPDFLRTAKNLTSEQWNDLSEHVKKIKKNK